MQNDTLVDTQNWFIKAVPTPTSKNISTQIGCHLEEVVEMLEELAPLTQNGDVILNTAICALERLAESMKESDKEVYAPNSNRLAILDSLADQIVTATGIGTFLGMNVPGALSEVNRSNYSKFVDGNPIFNENQKVMKGPDYTPPDLIPFI